MGPTGVALHAMGTKKRPTNHDAANLPTAAKKREVKTYKQEDVKNRDMAYQPCP